MSEDWESVTKIGSKVRAAGTGPKEKVIRGESALNAARRTGAEIATDKKFGGTNSVRFEQPNSFLIQAPFEKMSYVRDSA